MKKALLSVAFVFATFISAEAQTVLYEQAVNGTSGIVSGFQTIDPNAGAWSSDDFTLSETSLITNITVEGFSNSTDFDAIFEGAQIYIFSDNANQPSGTPDASDSWLFGYEVNHDAAGFMKISDGGSHTFSFDLSVISGTDGFVAQAGTKYWLTVAAVVNTGLTVSGSQRWNWYQAAPQNSDAHIATSGGLFGLTAGEWSAFPDLGLTFNGVNMLLEGTSDLSVELLDMDKVKVYPNPANDVINIANAVDSIEKVTITDLNGRVVKTVVLGVNEAQINISDLSQGVYLLNATSNGATVTEKIVKK